MNCKQLDSDHLRQRVEEARFKVREARDAACDISLDKAERQMWRKVARNRQQALNRLRAEQVRRQKVEVLA